MVQQTFILAARRPNCKQCVNIIHLTFNMFSI